MSAGAMEGLPKWLSNPTTIDASLKSPLESVEIDTRIRDALVKMDIHDFFAVQTAVIPKLLLQYGCHDLCVSAPTGSGKTLSFAIPIVQKLLCRKIVRLRALIVLPTRDLAVQVADTFKILVEHCDLRIGLLTGQQSFQAEQSILTNSECVMQGGNSLVDIAICTPGRLVDHLKNTPNFTLQHLEFLVIDEADRLLNQTYQNWLSAVIESAEYSKKPKENADVSLESQNDGFASEYRIANASFIDADAVTYRSSQLISSAYTFSTSWTVPLKKLLFSATLTRNPSKIASLKLNCPEYIAVVGSSGQRFVVPSTLQEFLLVCPVQLKPLFLISLITQYKLHNAICFTKSVESTEQLYQLLIAYGGLKVAAISSDKSAADRQKVIKQFAKGKIHMYSFIYPHRIICSDGMARGMDLNTSVVINYDSSMHLKTYLHRIGRTARAGKVGSAYSIVTTSEVKTHLQKAKHFKDMTKELERSHKIKKLKLDSDNISHLKPKFEEVLASLHT